MVWQIILWVLAGIGGYSLLQLFFGRQPPPIIDYNMLFIAGLIILMLFLLLK